MKCIICDSKQLLIVDAIYIGEELHFITECINCGELNNYTDGEDEDDE